jgi:hypothetical protein
MINRISRAQWQYIINNYFTNYYDNEKTRINRRKWRAMYLTNNDYVKSNPYLTPYTLRRINSYDTWYINYYNKNNNLN